MAKRKSRKKSKKTVETIMHDEASRKYIPTAEYESVIREEDKTPIQVAYERRNPDLDPQLVWRGKDVLDWSDLVVQAPPLYIQEKVHPKVLIDDMMQRTAEQMQEGVPQQMDLFADFNGLPNEVARTEFYQHDANWTNRMVLGDSLQVMASLSEREGLRGKVQCIYIDPPYGIKFNSNFQWSTTSRSIRDETVQHITREPEQVKAFRDTWREGIHSYLNYLRDRLLVSRDLLADSGSIFVQIGDENVHRLRSLLDEVFGDENFVSQIAFTKTRPLGASGLVGIYDSILWYAKKKVAIKYRALYDEKSPVENANYSFAQDQFGNRNRISAEDRRNYKEIEKKGYRIFQTEKLASSGYTKTCFYPIKFHGVEYPPKKTSWRTNTQGMDRLLKADHLHTSGNNIYYVSFLEDNPTQPKSNIWTDTRGDMNPVYVVQTATKVIERCVLMSSDPGDLVLDPTCGSGTTAFIAEQWGRRWITIDTSRVALALARARIMGARYPYYLLADSRDGQFKEAELTRTTISDTPTYGDIRQGFVYERVPHITLNAIANNSEVNVIWDQFQEALDPLRAKLNLALGEAWEEWEIPREANEAWPSVAKDFHKEWWEGRIARQREIDASIAAKADYEYLYDKPYEDRKTVRVAGPFTVESLSPHRILGVDENDELIDPMQEVQGQGVDGTSFVRMILENLKAAGVQQAHKEDKIDFTALTPWPGNYVCAEARYFEGGEEKGVERRVAIFIGPEFGTVSRPDLVAAACEAGDADFDTLIAFAFNYDAHSSEFDKLGRIPVLKARMNADLHMAEDLKNTGKGNLFVIFGEPDIDIMDAEDDQIQVRINGVDVFHPNTGEVRSDGAEGIACWFIDTDYNEESFFVRHAYFLGANDPYKSLKTTLKAEINQEAWETLNSDTSRPFDKPESCRIAVKVINHLGDEVMKVFRVE